MSKKIKLNIVRNDKEVKIKILYQDKRFIYRDGLKVPNYEYSFKASNGFQIKSCSCPEMNGDYMYLKGEDKDKVTCSRVFSSPKEAKAYISKLKAALIDWANHAPEFNDIETETFEV